MLSQQLRAGILVDDRDAKRLAASMGIQTGTTISVLLDAVRAGDISAHEAKALVDDLIDRSGRRLPRLSIAQFET